MKLLEKLQQEYSTILALGAQAEPEQKDRRQALSCIITEVQIGMLTGKQQKGDDSDVLLAANAWLEKIDIIYDPISRSIWSQNDLDDHHRVRKHLIEIITQLEPA